MKIKPYIAVLVIALIMFGCKSPQTINKGSYPIVYTTLKGDNLNGPIKEVRCLWKRNFKPVDPNKEIMTREFFRDSAIQYNGMSHEDIKYGGYYSYDKNGMRTTSFPLKDSITEPIPETSIDKYIYIYDKQQFNKLKKFTIQKSIPFPVYNPYTLKIGYGSERSTDVKEDSTELRLRRLYKYDFDKKGRVLNRKEYFNNPPIHEEYDVKTRLENIYNTKSQIISQQYHFIESDSSVSKKLVKILGHVDYTILLLEFDTSFDYYDYDIDFEYYGIKDSLNYKNFRNEFTYDDRGNISSFTFYVKNKPFRKETYNYNDQDVLVSLERYVQADQTVGPFDNYYKKEFFDEYGNIVKSVNAGDKEFTNPKIRLYEYTYDQYNNWTTCNMYLDGVKTEVPTIVANRIIVYYEN